MIDNLRFQGLIFLLALFAFYGCGENEPLGLPIGEDDNNINLQYKEFTLPAKMVYKDSIPTQNVGRIMTGRFSHPKLGNVTATSFGQLTPPSGSFNIPDNAEFDSLVMSFAGNYFYGDHEEEVKQFFSIHQLSDTIPFKSHYKFENFPYEDTALGQDSFNINPDEDSVFTIKLNDALGQDLFNKAKNEAPEMEDNSSFRTFFKGIAVVPGNNNTIMLGFDPESSLTGMQLHYHSDDDTTIENFSYDGGIHFNNFTTDVTGTGLAGKLQHNNSIEPVEGEVFLQSGAGIIPKLNFEPLQTFVEANDNQVIINKANLEVQTELYSHPFILPPQNLQPLFTDESNDLFIINTTTGSRPRGITSGRNLINIGFNSQDRKYEADITVFSQSVADKNSDFDNILLYPVGPSGGSNLNSTINYFIADTTDIKLKVYYTTLK